MQKTRHFGDFSSLLYHGTKNYAFSVKIWFSKLVHSKDTSGDLNPNYSLRWDMGQYLLAHCFFHLNWFQSHWTLQQSLHFPQWLLDQASLHHKATEPLEKSNPKTWYSHVPRVLKEPGTQVHYHAAFIPARLYPYVHYNWIHCCFVNGKS